MKTLANCTPAEFLQQGYKVIDAAKDLLETTKVLELRKRLPSYSGAETEEQKADKVRAQAKKNIMDMLGVLMEENPEKTAKVLGLMCFIDPKDIDKHKGIEFLIPATELLSSKEVIDFFTSLISQK